MLSNVQLSGRVRQLAPLVAVSIVVLGYAYVGATPYHLAVGVNIGVAAIAAIGLTLAIGGAGQLALGQAGFMAIGSYGTAYLMHADRVTFLLAVPISVLAALVVGTLVGYIALRLRGNYLAMATLAVGSGIYALLSLPNRLGGQNGYAGIPFPTIGSFTFIDPRAQYLLVAVTLILVLIAARLLLASRVGSELAALRDDEVAARSIGVHITTRKVQVFAVSAVIGALAGAVNAPLQTAIDPTLFSPSVSLQLFVMVVLGGLGNVYGAVLGAALVTWLIQTIPGNGSWALTLLGIVVVVFMALLPDGIIGAPARVALLAGRLTGRAGGRGSWSAGSGPAVAPAAEAADAGVPDAELPGAEVQGP